MLIYLDVCCWNRRFDGLAIPRNRNGAAAILEILNRARAGAIDLVSSDAQLVELSRMPSPLRRRRITALLAWANTHMHQDDAIEVRADELTRLSFRLWDATHIACAEAAGCGVLLTTDDRMIGKARQHARTVQLRVENPMQWLLEFDNHGR